MGEQIIDIEGLANHKGSVFGHLGEREQPTNQQFENELAMEWINQFGLKMRAGLSVK